MEQRYNKIATIIDRHILTTVKYDIIWTKFESRSGYRILLADYRDVLMIDGEGKQLWRHEITHYECSRKWVFVHNNMVHVKTTWGDGIVYDIETGSILARYNKIGNHELLNVTNLHFMGGNEWLLTTKNGIHTVVNYGFEGQIVKEVKFVPVHNILTTINRIVGKYFVSCSDDELIQICRIDDGTYLPVIPTKNFAFSNNYIFYQEPGKIHYIHNSKDRLSFEFDDPNESEYIDDRDSFYVIDSDNFSFDHVKDPDILHILDPSGNHITMEIAGILHEAHVSQSLVVLVTKHKKDNPHQYTYITELFDLINDDGTHKMFKRNLITNKDHINVFPTENGFIFVQQSASISPETYTRFYSSPHCKLEKIPLPRTPCSSHNRLILGYKDGFIHVHEYK